QFCFHSFHLPPFLHRYTPVHGSGDHSAVRRGLGKPSRDHLNSFLTFTPLHLARLSTNQQRSDRGALDTGMTGKGTTNVLESEQQKRGGGRGEEGGGVESKSRSRRSRPQKTTR